MNANRKSDESVVPATSANNGVAETPAESIEERDSAKRNAEQTALRRTPGRIKCKSRGLHGVREAARKDDTLKFTALLHHVNEDCLREAFFHLKKTAAVGVDGVTWHEYERNVEANIVDLHDRIHRGAYRARPSRRAWMPKPDGRQRPLGIASLEDKIVQQAVLWVLQSIYEQDFLGFSYGFRPGRSQHDALDALSVAITGKRVNWILDADIEGFFDAIDHEWLVKFLEHRIGDRRILRLIRKWLRAGVSEEGQWSKTTVGAPQGSVISPLLSNVYLHYVFDLWIEWWRKHRCRGDVVVVRYADDFVIGFESHGEATACLEELHARFAKFGLKLHAGKTRLIEFGRYAIERRERHGEGRPETFDFLGIHAQVRQDTQTWSVRDPSPLRGETHASDIAGDQNEIAKANAPPNRRNGPMAATSCTGMAELSRRPKQLEPHPPLRGRGNSSLVACHSPPQSTWSSSLDMGSDATSCETVSTPSKHRPPLSGQTISRSTQGKSRMR